MRPTPWLKAEPHRIVAVGAYESRPGDSFGAFQIPYNGTTLLCLVQTGENSRAELGDEYAWDHISVSARKRCPNWFEMSHIKSIFFAEDETVMQLHVPESEHIDLHPYTLHLWRPLLVPIPRPPSGAV